MTKTRRGKNLRTGIFILIDGFFVLAGVMLAQLISSHLPNLSSLFTPLQEAISVPLYFLFVAVWLLALTHTKTYDPEKNLRVVDETYNLFSGAFISTIFLSCFLYLSAYPLPIGIFLLSVLISFTLLVFYRLIYRLTFQKTIRQITYQQRILIAGAGQVGRRFEQEINDFSQVGYKLVGFLDDDPIQIDSHEDVLGNLDQAADLIMEHQIDNLIIALPQRAQERVNTLLESVHKLHVRVWVIPDYFTLMLSKSSVWNFVGIPMITLRSPTLNRRQRFMKRVFDLVLTIPSFLITLPLFGLIALLIKIDSPGPVLYRSLRIKENGSTFKMLKFRTMVDHADQRLPDVIKTDEHGHKAYKQPDDPRITRIGKILRRTSLDELPQLIHILKGEMSLVGPRPELPELVSQYEPWQYMRFSVPQGLTGWWQVNGRSDKPMHLHTDEDLYYIQHYSIWLDIQILIKTVLVVLRGKGAY